MVNLTGLAATGGVTVPTITGTALVNLPTISALASALGTVGVVINVQPTITGLEASANMHQVTVIGDAIVPETGLAATASVGGVTQRTTAVIPAASLAATGAVGTVTVTGGSSVTVGGVAGSGEVGTVLVWGRIIPEYDTVWTEIVAA